MEYLYRKHLPVCTGANETIPHIFQELGQQCWHRSLRKVGMLTNDAAKGEYRVLSNLDGVTVGKIARADVADFLLRQLTSDTYLHQFPTICY